MGTYELRFNSFAATFGYTSPETAALEFTQRALKIFSL